MTITQRNVLTTCSITTVSGGYDSPGIKQDTMVLNQHYHHAHTKAINTIILY